MAPKVSKNSLLVALVHYWAQAAQGGTPRASSKSTNDSSEITSDSQPLVIKQGKKRASNDVVDLEATSNCQSTLPFITNTLSRLKKVYSAFSEDFHLLHDFQFDAPPFSLWCPRFPLHQKGYDLLKSNYDFNIFEVAGATKMYKWIQVVCLRSYTITRHLELRERSDSTDIIELKEELMKLREAYSREIRSLEDKVKKAKDKYSIKEKEWGAQEKILQDKVTLLEKKFKEHEDFYATKVANSKRCLMPK